jgi:AraC-like DNA-binding protein
MNTTPPTVLFGEIDIVTLENCVTEFKHLKISDEIEICTYLSSEFPQTHININNISNLNLIVMIKNCQYLIPTDKQSNDYDTLLILKRIDHLMEKQSSEILSIMSKADLNLHCKLSEIVSNYLKSFKINNKKGFLSILSLRIWAYQLIFNIVDEISHRILPTNLIKYKRDDIQKIRDLADSLKENFQVTCPSLNEMAEYVGMSVTKFKSIFKEVWDESPHQYILDLRLGQAKKMLENKELSVSEIAYKVGFNHPSELTRLFKNKLGISPYEIFKT